MSLQAPTAAAPDKGAAARAEKDPQPKALQWRGLDLTLPATLSVMRLTATWRRFERAAEAKDSMATMGYLVDLVDVVLGDDAQQADRVWAKIDADQGDQGEAILDLVGAAADCYGVEPGESPASQ